MGPTAMKSWPTWTTGDSFPCVLIPGCGLFTDHFFWTNLSQCWNGVRRGPLRPRSPVLYQYTAGGEQVFYAVPIFSSHKDLEFVFSCVGEQKRSSRGLRRSGCWALGTL